MRSLLQFRLIVTLAFLPFLVACQDLAASSAAKPERPVQVQRVGQILQVDDVRQVPRREPQDAERTTGGGVATGPERDDLQPDVRQLGGLQQRLDLPLLYPAPPIGRRSTASSSTAHSRGGSARVRIVPRAIRSSTARSTSSRRRADEPSPITARAYSSVCSRPGTNCTS